MKQSYKWFSVMAITIALASCQSSPGNLLNNRASLTSSDELPENPLLLIPLTSSINPQDSTMSTLYGNQLSAIHAKTEAGNTYPKGAILYEVTWKQQPDSVWFGANIPKEIFSVERILFNEEGTPEYELFKGKPLRKSTSQNEIWRIAFISTQRMAMSP